MARNQNKSIAVRLSLDSRAFRKGLVSAQKNLGKFANSMKKLSGIVAVSAAAIAGVVGVTMVSAFVKFEFQMAKVKAMSSATAKEFKKLNDSARQIGATTMKTATEVASLQYELAKLGFKPQQIESMQRSIVQLGIAFDEDLGFAAEQVGSTLRQFELSAGHAAMITDMMSEAFSNSALNLERFSETIKYSGKNAYLSGMQFEDFTATLGVLANNAQIGSRAGTSLRQMLIESTKAGREFADMIEEVASATDQEAKAVELFGKRASTAAIVIARGGAEIDELRSKLIQAQGATAKMEAIMNDTSKGALKRMSSAFNDLSIEVGGLVAKAIMPLIKVFTDFIRNANAPLIAGFIKITAIIAGSAGIMWAFLAFAGVLVKVMVPFKSLIVLLYQLIKAMVVAGLKALQMGAKFIAAWFMALGPIPQLIVVITAAILLLVAKFTNFSDFFSQLGADIANIFIFIANALIGLWYSVKAYVQLMIQAYSSLWDVIKSVGGAIAGVFKGIADWDWDAVKNALSSGVDDIIADFDNMGDKIKEIVEQNTKDAKDNMVDYLTAQDVKDAAGSAGKWMVEKFEQGLDYVKGKVEDFGKNFGGDGSSAASGGNDRTWVSHMKSKKGGAKESEFSGSTFDNASNILELLGKDTSATIAPLKSPFEEWIRGLDFDEVLDVFSNLTSSIQDLWGSVFDFIHEKNQQQIDDAVRSKDAQIAAVDKLALSEEDKEKRRAKITKKADAEIAKLKLKQWKADKKANLGKAIMNTALAVTSALGSGPPPYNFIMAAISAAAGAFQIATIKSQQPPKFAEGGIVSGRTLAEVGEYSGVTSNPEVIAPLDKLKSMMGFGTQNINITGQFIQRGTDLVAVIDETNVRLSRY